MKTRILSTSRLSFPLASAIAALITSQTVHAADGTWLGNSGNWNATGTWFGGTIADGTGFTANFTGVNIPAERTITLGADRTIGNIIFTDATTSSHNLLITGANILTLDVASGIPAINVTQSDRTLTISSVIAGTDGLQKTGAGTLTLNGSAVNTFTGGLNINAGTLALDFANLATPTNLVNSGNALQINSGTLTITGKSDASNNTFQTFNGTTLGAGVNTINLTKGASATSANLALGALTLTAGSATVINTGTAWAVNAIPAAEKITISSGGNIALPVSGQVYANAGLFYRTTTSTAGTARYVAVDSAGNLRGQVANTAALAVGTNTPAAVNSFGSTIAFTTTTASSYALVLNSGGTGRILTLAANGTYELNGMVQAQATNDVTINAGTGTSNIIIGSERNLVINMDNSAPLTINAPIADNSGGASAVTLASTALSGTTPGTVTFGGANTFSGRLSVVNSTLSIASINNVSTNGVLGNSALSVILGGSGGQRGTLAYTAASGSSSKPFTLTTGGSGAFDVTTALTLSGQIDGGGGLVKLGNGSLTLSGTNTYSGTTSITTGTLRLENTAALGSSPLVQITNRTLQFATDTAFSGPNVSITSGGTIVSDRFTPSSPGITHVLGDATIGNGTTNYTAGSNVSGGTAAIQLGNVSNNNGSVSSITLNPTTANIIITGNYTLGTSNTGTANLTLGGTGSVNSIAGAIVNGTRDTGNLIKSGTSTWTLTGASTYNGTTSVRNGSLILDAGDDRLPTTGSVVLGEASNSGKLVLGGTTKSDQTFAGLTTTGLGGSVVGGNATVSKLTLEIASTNDFSGTLGGAGTNENNLALTKTGSGTLTLSGVNSYSGITTIKAGTLKINTSTTIGSSSKITVGDTGSSGTVLDTTTAGLTVGSGQTLAGIGQVLATGQTVTIDGTLAPGNSPGTLSMTVGNLDLGNATSLAFELNPLDTTVGANINDLVAVTGNLNLDGLLSVVATSGDFLSVVANTSWRLFDYSGSFTDDTLSLGSMPSLASGLSWSIDTATTGQVNLVVIPEPRAALLGGLGLLALLRRRRH